MVRRLKVCNTHRNISIRYYIIIQILLYQFISVSAIRTTDFWIVCGSNTILRRRWPRSAAGQSVALANLCRPLWSPRTFVICFWDIDNRIVVIHNIIITLYYYYAQCDIIIYTHHIALYIIIIIYALRTRRIKRRNLKLIFLPCFFKHIFSPFVFRRLFYSLTTTTTQRRRRR